MSSHPSRTTEELPHPGQRAPSGQRCWRTKAKHFASSISPERLTKLDAGMVAEAPRASRLAARAFQPSHQIPANRTTRITTPELDKSQPMDGEPVILGAFRWCQ